MPDLNDGQTAEVWGSTARPYVLKNVGGVYSCSCPAWRNQSLPIERTGQQVIVRYGRIGTVGQSQTRAFSDEAAARTHANRLIDQKLAKGYAECAVA